MATRRISVIIPAHNEAEYIEAALASLAAQDYFLDLLECIVVDNASSDTTGQVARCFGARHPEIHLKVVDEAVPGVGRAKNRGAGVATGEILLFLDADSRMSPNLARSVVDRYGVGYPAGSIRITADSSNLIERGFFNLMEVGKVWFGVRGQMMYCGSEVFQSVGGFDPNLLLAEDLDFLRRVRRSLPGGHRQICHIREATIATSTRRMQRLPFRLSLAWMFARWLLAFVGIGRRRTY